MVEYFAELVVPDAADVCGTPAEIGESRDRVRNGTARHFGGRSHQFVDLVSTPFVDQVHRAGHDAESLNELVIDVSEHIDDCVTDA